ncbi:hypothetical protein OG754_40065 (plasmid) [Streptomyces decoyicus]|uniref:hypothetical protein n=1 Tax=Streptomyces decoyicus TaxID=249567 RepID=UPI002E2EF38F|nr:hypothetical protein [Streptomyces decoyicus]
MWSRHVTTGLTALVVGAASLSMSPVAAAATTAVCTPSSLPLPAGTTDGTVTSSDSGGGYAGETYGTSARHAVRWKNGQITDYGVLPGMSGASTTVTGVNRDGTVVGYAVDADNTSHPFRSREGKLEALPVPSFDGTMNAFATAVNDNGDIVGWAAADRDKAPMAAVMWPASAPGTVVRLTGGLPETGQTSAVGIDQDGTVLVNVHPEDDPVSATAAYLWRAGNSRKLAAPSGAAQVQGYGISNGRVAGRADTSGIVWDHNGTIVRADKGELLYSINRTGQSVGYQPSAPGAQVLGVWQLGTKIATLAGIEKTVSVSADDGSLAGSIHSSTTRRTTPTTWRCG